MGESHNTENCLTSCRTFSVPMNQAYNQYKLATPKYKNPVSVLCDDTE
jgi:hypothetical protein